MRIDTVLTGLTALTLDDDRPRARRIGVHHGRIVALDDELDGIRAHRTIDLGGACVVPGFDDAHNHMALYGLSRAELDLSSPPLHSLDDLYEAVAARAAELPPGSWLTGSGYDQNKLGGQHPHREVLDRVAPRHKVWLKHTSAHMCVVNSAVLREISGPSPSGGRIATDYDGRPTGLIEEQAQTLVRDLVYPYSTGELADAIGRASDDYLREGVTSCTEAGIGLGWIGHSPVEAAAYQRAREDGRLGVRVRLMVTTDTLHPVRRHRDDPASTGLDLGLHTGFGDEWLRLGAVKVFSDGSLIGRTAAMCCDFAGEAGNRGYLQADEEELRRRITAAHAAGWQVATHAIGDRAVDVVLDAYEEAARAHPRPGTRHRIEHCGVTRPDQLPRLARLGVVPVPQAAFIGRLGDGMRAALGEERTAWAYRHRSFLAAGLTVPGSSDRPIVPGAPLRGIHDMVNRRTESGAPFGTPEAVPALEALRAYTAGSAYAAFEEDAKGSITPGKLADFAVLDQDPTTVAPEQLADIRVLGTVVGGAFGYDGVGFGG